MKSLTHAAALEAVKAIVADIFECDPASLHETTRLMTDLPCESVDLLEISIRLGQACHIAVDDETAFLRSVRLWAADGPQALAAACSHLPEARREEIRLQVSASPALSPLSLGDLAHYATYAAAQG